MKQYKLVQFVIDCCRHSRRNIPLRNTQYYVINARKKFYITSTIPTTAPYSCISQYLDCTSRLYCLHFNKCQELLYCYQDVHKIKNVRTSNSRSGSTSRYDMRSTPRRLNIHRHRARIRSLLRCGGRFSNKRTSLTSSLSS